MQRAFTGNDAMFDGLNKLKQDLNESNQANIGNLTFLNDHIELLFGYFRDAFMALARQKSTLQHRLFSLQTKLKARNLQYLLYEEENAGNQSSFNQSLENINQKMRKAIMQRNKLSQFSNETRPQRNCKAKSILTNKQQSRQEYSRATNFVRDQLIGKLQEQPNRTEQLPKNAFLNLYLKWREKKQQPVDYQFLSSIQMALTNEIKRHFPDSSHNSRSFRGIQFRQQLKPFIKGLFKSDVKARKEEDEDDDSPPLPTFPDDHLAI